MIMSNEKNTSTEHREAQLRPAQGMARKAVKRRQDVEVIALEIDEDSDRGGDPYNHTGSHCVVKLRDD